MLRHERLRVFGTVLNNFIPKALTEVIAKYAKPGFECAEAANNGGMTKDPGFISQVLSKFIGEDDDVCSYAMKYKKGKGFPSGYVSSITSFKHKGKEISFAVFASYSNDISKYVVFDPFTYKVIKTGKFIKEDHVGRKFGSFVRGGKITLYTIENNNLVIFNMSNKYKIKGEPTIINIGNGIFSDWVGRDGKRSLVAVARRNMVEMWDVEKQRRFFRLRIRKYYPECEGVIVTYVFQGKRNRFIANILIDDVWHIAIYDGVTDKKLIKTNITSRGYTMRMTVIGNVLVVVSNATNRQLGTIREYNLNTLNDEGNLEMLRETELKGYVFTCFKCSTTQYVIVYVDHSRKYFIESHDVNSRRIFRKVLNRDNYNEYCTLSEGIIFGGGASLMTLE